MKPLRPTGVNNNWQRRVGRKVLLADRLAHMVHGPEITKNTFQLPSFLKQPRFVMKATAITIAIAVIGVGGSHVYTSQVSAAQKVAAAAKQKQLQAEGKKANACRQQKTSQKAKMLNTITYDELYDHGACDN